MTGNKQDRSRSHRNLMLALLALAMLGSGVLWGMQTPEPQDLDLETALAAPKQDEKAADLDAGEVAERSSVSAKRDEGLYAAPIGTRMSYRLNGATTYAMAAGESPSAGGQSMRIVLRSQMHVDVLARASEHILVGVELEGFSMKPDGAPESELVKEQARTIARPFRMRLRKDGSVSGYRFAKESTAESRNFARTVVGALEFVAPTPLAREWKAEGSDATGTHMCRYEKLSDKADHVVLRRTKLHYTSMAQLLGDQAPAHKLSSSAKARFSRKLGWLETADVDEELQMVLPMMDATLTTRFEAQVRLGSVQHGVATAPED